MWTGGNRRRCGLAELPESVSRRVLVTLLYRKNILPAGDAEGILAHIVCGAALTLPRCLPRRAMSNAIRPMMAPHQQGNADLCGIENVAAVIGWLVVRVVNHVIRVPGS